MSSVPARDPIATTLVVVFALVISSFLATSIFARQASSEIASLSDRLATNVSASIEDLASVRGSVLQAELGLSRLLHAEEIAPERVQRVQEALGALKRAVEDYLALPPAPGEHRLYGQIDHTWRQFVGAARLVRELAIARDFDRARENMRELDLAAEALVQASIAAIEFNAQSGQRLAKKIGRSRQRTARIAVGLTGLSVILGVAGAMLLHRQARRRRQLADERARALEERAAELEEFAGRVAHDIRGPLGVASMGVGLLSARGALPPTAQDTLARVERSIGRATAITADLLQFARAGAKPDPGARTSVRGAIADIRDDLSAEAAQYDIELVWHETPPVRIACGRGVFLSMLGNLVRNAIKHMGEQAHRQIAIRITDEGGNVRTEVTDTGPGIPAHELGRLFDPYFRGGGAAREGIGLGLPTVRKLADGHNGRAGVSSTEDKGSTFWFVLPRAGSDSDSHRQSKGTGR